MDAAAVLPWVSFLLLDFKVRSDVTHTKKRKYRRLNFFSNNCACLISFRRTCVENAFGIMAKVTCMLHNFLCISTGAPTLYCPTGYADIEDTFGNVRDGALRIKKAVENAECELVVTPGGMTSMPPPIDVSLASLLRTASQHPTTSGRIRTTSPLVL